MKVELLPHQLEALEKMHNGCVVWGGVGVGKTITALRYAQVKEPDKQIVVVTTAKVRDSGSWEWEAAKLGILPGDFQITSWNKINDFVGYVDHIFIFDEQRLVGAGAWVKAFYKIAKANRWILLSATPGDTWSDYAPMFIANGWYKNITEFRREHAIYSRFTKYPKIERWVNEGRLQKYRKHLLVEMPMARHTTRHMHYIECEYDRETLDYVKKKRWNIYKDEPIKNASELFGVLRKIVSTDPSRSFEIKKLVEKHPKLIVFYNFDYELDILRELCTQLEKEKSWESKTSKNSLETSSPQTSRLSEKPATTSPPDGKLLETIPTKPARLSEPKRPLETSLDPSSTTSSTSSRLTATTSPSSKSFGWAEWNGHKHQALPETDSWVYLVQYMSGSEGWNCIETDAIAFWSLTYSWKQFHQAQGRIDRLNTLFVDLHYYILMTKSFAERPVMAALNAKHDFQPR